MARLQSLRDTPNTAREYETIYILRPNTANEGVAEVNAKIKGVIETMGGKIIKVDNWGKRRLAYEVAKERKGIYLYWLYLAQPGIVEEAERNLRMLDNVIRYLTVKVDENVDVGARPTEVDDTTFDKAAQTAADEEDLFLSRGAEEVPGGDDDDDVFGSDEFTDEPGSVPPLADKEFKP
jgi:small subunit ribosomal protein S6